MKPKDEDKIMISSIGGVNSGINSSSSSLAGRFQN